MLAVNELAWQAYAVAVALLGLKTLLVVVAAVKARKDGVMATPASPEDLGTLYKGHREAQEPGPKLRRLQAIHRNDIENLALFVPLGLVAVLSGGGAFVAALCLSFAAMRYVHTAVYALGLQPWRTLVWGLGSFLPLVALALAVLVQVFAG